nr:MAG TPA: hypothetical protein [Caudoviricetes sp.]
MFDCLSSRDQHRLHLAVSNFFTSRLFFYLLRRRLVLHGADSEIVFIGGTSSCPINLISKYYHIGNKLCNQLG